MEILTLMSAIISAFDNIINKLTGGKLRCSNKPVLDDEFTTDTNRDNPRLRQIKDHENPEDRRRSELVQGFLKDNPNKDPNGQG